MGKIKDFERHRSWSQSEYYLAHGADNASLIAILELQDGCFAVRSVFFSIHVTELQARVLAMMPPAKVWGWAEGRRYDKPE